MGLKVISWLKSKNNELIPVCQPNDILIMNIEDTKWSKLGEAMLEIFRYRM